MWVWLVLAVLGLALWRFAAFADRIEDDSEGMVDSHDRQPYGTKWLSILIGTDNHRHDDRH